MDADEAEGTSDKIDELLSRMRKLPRCIWKQARTGKLQDWLVEDIFQRTYQDMMPDSAMRLLFIRMTLMRPSGCGGMVVDASAQEIKPSHRIWIMLNGRTSATKWSGLSLMLQSADAYEDYPEQMDVIYAVAENGGSLEELLNLI